MNWYTILKQKITELDEDMSTLLVLCDTWDLFYDDNPDFRNYGTHNDCNFTAYTTNYVYFPLEYDGLENVGYAPRNPELNVKMSVQ